MDQNYEHKKLLKVTDVVSCADAVAVWIGRREDRLSASTEGAYRGEVDYVEQFLVVKY
jgi:hypothetical protein